MIRALDFEIYIKDGEFGRDDFAYGLVEWILEEEIADETIHIPIRWYPIGASEFRAPNELLDDVEEITNQRIKRNPFPVGFKRLKRSFVFCLFDNI